MAAAHGISSFAVTYLKNKIPGADIRRFRHGARVKSFPFAPGFSLRAARGTIQERWTQKGETGLLPVLALGVILSLAWLAWSGFFKPLLLSLGAISVALTVYLAVRTSFFEHARGLFGMSLRLPAYWFWLLVEIIKSSIDVAKIVLSPSLPISPSLVRLHCPREAEMPQTILGNSITLSPGTITIDIDEKEALVHCLSEKGAIDIESGEILRRIRHLEDH